MRRVSIVAGGLVVGALVATAVVRKTTSSTRSARPAMSEGRPLVPPTGIARYTTVPTGSSAVDATEDRDLPGMIADEGPYSDDPTSPDYDASRTVFDRHHLYADALWAAEPRREPWATRRTQALLAYVGGDITGVDPDARVDIDCRTATCRVRVYSSQARLTNRVYPFSCMAKLGVVMELGAGDGPDRFSELYLVFHPRSVADEGFLAYQQRYCAEERRRWISYVQEQDAE